MFSVIFHTSVRCRKPSSADWSESGKLCHQAGLIFTSIRWVKTLPTQLRISDYQPSKMISWTEVILRSSSSISPLGLPAFYFRSLSSVWDGASVISLVPLPHPSCHFILDYISLSAFYTFFFTNAVYFLSTIICSNSEDFMKPMFLIMSPKLCSKQFLSSTRLLKEELQQLVTERRWAEDYFYIESLKATLAIKLWVTGTRCLLETTRLCPRNP